MKSKIAKFYHPVFLLLENGRRPVCEWLVCKNDPTPRRRKGSGNIGADSWFCKLSNHVIICIGLYWSMCGHVMVRRNKKRPAMSPDPFLACMVGSGNENTKMLAATEVVCST